MPELQSYAQTLKHQISPMANQLLNTVFDNFSEKLKSPDSSERKVFDTVVAIMACTMLSEKLVQETHTLLHYLEDLNKRHDDVKKAKPIKMDDEEKEEEETEEVDINEILADLDNRLTRIQERKGLLKQEFDKNMESLTEQELATLGEIFGGINFSGSELYSKIAHFYEQRKEPQPERLEKFVELLQETLGDKYPPGVLMNLAEQIDAKETGFMALKTGLQENYNKAINELDKQAEGIQKQKELLVQKRAQPAAAPESAKPAGEAPSETPELPSAPTLTPGSGST